VSRHRGSRRDGPGSRLNLCAVVERGAQRGAAQLSLLRSALVLGPPSDNGAVRGYTQEVDRIGLAPTDQVSSARRAGKRRGAPAASRWWKRLPWTPGRIVVVYAVMGALWILLSDRALLALVSDAGMHARAQTFKGGAFVVLTSIVLLELIRRRERGILSFGAEVRATVDSMVDAVLVIDESSRIVEANRAALELLGAATKEEVLGPVKDLGLRVQLRYLDGTPVPPDRFASIRALGGARVQGYDALLRRHDGRDVAVNVSAALVGEGARSRLAVAVLRDISAARRLDEMREEFLSTAAHELKTPLAVIKAYAQLVQKRIPAEAAALEVVQRQVDRLNRIVHHLLDTSRLRLEPDAGPREPFDLAALAEEVIGRERAAASRHTLALVTAAAPVRANRERIARVLASLVDNAVRFSPRGGAVEARVEVREGQAVVSVRDRGLGIPPERQARIFERYYRAHGGTPDDYGGLGLSLEMSREIVSCHGGRMWFESAPGEGSTFHFSLPLDPGAAA